MVCIQRALVSKRMMAKSQLGKFHSKLSTEVKILSNLSLEPELQVVKVQNLNLRKVLQQLIQLTKLQQVAHRIRTAHPSECD